MMKMDFVVWTQLTQRQIEPVTLAPIHSAPGRTREDSSIMVLATSWRPVFYTNLPLPPLSEGEGCRSVPLDVGIRY